jgi:hypothetical protein
MDIKIFSPLIFTVILFGSEAIIKIVAFDFNAAFFDISPKLCLWAIGLLFGVIRASRELHRGQERIITKEKFLFILAYSICSWMVTVVLSQKSLVLYHAANAFTLSVQGLAVSGFILAGLSVGAAITITKEVDIYVRNQ